MPAFPFAPPPTSCTARACERVQLARLASYVSTCMMDSSYREYDDNASETDIMHAVVLETKAVIAAILVSFPQPREGLGTRLYS